MRTSPLVALAATALLTLSACSSADEPVAQETVSATAAPSQEGTDASTPPVVDGDAGAGDKEKDASKEEVKIREAGVGQDGEYAWVTALVQTRGFLGESLTVHFNVYDEQDELITSTDQVEFISSSESVMAIGTQVEVGAQHAARVEATHVVSDYGMSSEDFDVIEPVPVTLSEEVFGSSYTLENPTDEPWTGLRVGVVCRSAEGTIVGGGSDYPELIPANGESKSDSLYIITADYAAECTAYPQHSDW